MIRVPALMPSAGRGSPFRLRITLVNLAMLTLVPAAAWGFQTASSNSSQQYFNQGARFQQRGDLGAAREAYQKALDLQPDRIDALSNLGLVEFRLHNYPRAIALLKRAVELQPELSQVRQFLALAYFEAAEFSEAHRQVSLLVQRNPADAKACHLLALCLLKLNRVEEGIEALEAVVDADPGNLQAAYTLASTYLTAEDIEKAEAMLQGPLRSEQGAEMHLVRGAIHMARREYRPAILELEQALRLDAKLPTAHERLGRAYLASGNYEQAEGEFRAEIESHPKDFHANTSLGFLLVKQHRYDEALQRLAAAQAQNPGHPAPLFLLGQIYQTANEPAKSAELLEQVVARHPEYTPAHVLLAQAYAKLKRTDDFRREQAVIRRLNEQAQTRASENQGTLPGLPETPLDAAGAAEAP